MTEDDEPSPWPGRLLAGGLVVVVAAALVAGIGPATREVRRRRRHGGLTTDAERVQALWADVEDALSRSGVRPHASDTPRELASRAVRSRLVPAGLVEPLADDVTAARWDPAGVDPGAVAQAEAVLAAVEAELRAPLSWSQRAWRWLDPRTHRGREPSDRRAVLERARALRH